MNFNTENVRDMSSMFAGCKSLKSINLSNFSTKKAEYIMYMFDKVPRNCKIICNDKKICKEINSCLIF